MDTTLGVKILTSVFAIFTFCYIRRTFYDFFVTPDLIFSNIFSGVTLPILWDFVPIVLMFTYHYKNCKSMKKEQDLRSKKH